MEQKKKEMLMGCGVDFEDAVRRFMGNEALFEKFLGKFAEDTSFQELKACMDAGDCEGAFRAAHTLKGVAGNLSMGRLYEVIQPLVEALREGDLEKAKGLYPETEKHYEDLMAVLTE